MSKKPKLGTIVKEITEAVGIKQCAKCEERQFTMDKWTHKRPICKIDCKDCEAFNSAEGFMSIDYLCRLYYKYFGLDNSNTKSEKVTEAMYKDLNKLFNDGV
jgi:hypothetical protein